MLHLRIITPPELTELETVISAAADHAQAELPNPGDRHDRVGGGLGADQ